MWNTESNEFYTVTIKRYGMPEFEQTLFIFESFDQAIDYIKGDSSWDCRPHGGSMNEWYDAGSGYTYKIESCDDCGRF
jgi:hypothetical protein